MSNKLKVGDTIAIHGFVMLKGMQGTLIVAKIDDISYHFTKTKGKEVVARHYCNDVDRWIDNKGSDINYIVKQ
jgi:hypothetical protein